MDLDLRRRFFAEELEAVCALRSRALVDGFAAVPRERFLRPGPWTVLADGSFLAAAGMQTRLTPDADPARASERRSRTIAYRTRCASPGATPEARRAARHS